MAFFAARNVCASQQFGAFELVIWFISFMNLKHSWNVWIMHECFMQAKVFGCYVLCILCYQWTCKETIHLFWAMIQNSSKALLSTHLEVQEK